MPVVTVRDAQRGDAPAIADVFSAAVPFSVRSAAGTSAELKADGALGRHRWVGLVDGQLAGTATGQQVGEVHGRREVSTRIEVHPDLGSRGVGTALLSAVAQGFPGTTWLRSVAVDDPISMAFAVRNGFLPESERLHAVVDPASVPAAGPEPGGLRSTTLDALPDLRMLLATHNLAAPDDPTGRTRRYTMYQLRSEWWAAPDHAADLSFGLLGEGGSGPELVAFSTAEVDRDRRRARSTMTATHPAYRGRGLAGWVTRRMLNALADAGVQQAWVTWDEEHPQMLALHRGLGYAVAARSVQVGRRLGTARPSGGPPAR